MDGVLYNIWIPLPLRRDESADYQKVEKGNIYLPPFTCLWTGRLVNMPQEIAHQVDNFNINISGGCEAGLSHLASSGSHERQFSLRDRRVRTTAAADRTSSVLIRALMAAIIEETTAMDTTDSASRLDVAQKRRLEEDAALPTTSGSEGESDGEEGWAETKSRKRANPKKKRVTADGKGPANAGQSQAVEPAKAGP
ncbi:hypothetical protein QE152_g41201, partial [Popillia japonica]